MDLRLNYAFWINCSVRWQDRSQTQVTKGDRSLCIGHCPHLWHLWNPPLQPIHHSQQSYCLGHKNKLSHNHWLCCTGWNGCSEDFHRCEQYPMDLLWLPYFDYTHRVLGKCRYFRKRYQYLSISSCVIVIQNTLQSYMPTQHTDMKDTDLARQDGSSAFLSYMLFRGGGKFPNKIPENDPEHGKR